MAVVAVSTGHFRRMCPNQPFKLAGKQPKMTMHSPGASRYSDPLDEIPTIDPRSVLTEDELKVHIQLCLEALQRLYKRTAQPQSATMRRLLRNLRILNMKITDEVPAA